MATMINVDDVHANVKVIYGLCPGDPVTIVVDNSLGGGGNPNNYHFNWFSKNNTNNCVTYNTTKYNRDRAVRIFLQFGFTTVTSWSHPYLGVNIDYGIPQPLSVFMTDLVNAVTGNGFYVESVGPTTINIVDSEDFWLTYLENTTFYTFQFINDSNGVTDCTSLITGLPRPCTSCVFTYLTGVLHEEVICGWDFVAGGINVDSYTTPPGDGIYMVEVVDEVGSTDYAIVEVKHDIIPCTAEIKFVTCNGKSDGYIKLPDIFSNVGGPLTYTWTKDGSFYSNDKDLYNISGGLYCVTIENANGCFRDCCYQIYEPEPLEILTISHRDPTCVTCNTVARYGEIIVEVIGGNTDCVTPEVSPYEYSLNKSEWKRLDADNTLILDRLTLGTYLLKIRDCKSCLSSQIFSITESFINVKI